MESGEAMGSELLLYIYGFICLGMIVFNVLHSLILKRRERTLMEKGRRLEWRMREQFQRISQGMPVDRRHRKYLRWKLLRVGNLIAFERILENCSGEEAVFTERYLSQLYPELLYLATAYLKKETMQTAYFAFFLSRHGSRIQTDIDSLKDLMVEYVRKGNLYCRLNALEALYALGSPENVVRAVQIQDEVDLYFNEKILTDGLLSFSGSHRQLISLLWESFPRFSVNTKLAVLNYIRFRTGAYCGEFYEILADERMDKELRLSAVRYFGRYPYEPVREMLLGFLQDETPMNWEYAAMSATALERYPGEDVTEALLEAIHSRNWFVRYNAAISLEERQLDYDVWLGVMDGPDRFAREMAAYRLEELRRKEEKKVEAV